MLSLQEDKEMAVTSCCVHYSVMSAKILNLSIVSVCGNFGMTAAVNFVYRSISGAVIFNRFILSSCGH